MKRNVANKLNITFAQIEMDTMKRTTAHNKGLAVNAARNICANFEVSARRHFGKPCLVMHNL